MIRKTDRAYLREWRLAKGLTQPDLAKRVGTVKSEISRLENGTRRMTVDWMSTIGQALGISVEELMSVPPMGFGTVSPPPKQGTSDRMDVIDFGGIQFGVGGTHAVTTITGDDWVGAFTPGDLLIYDTSKKSTAVPGIVALEVGGEQLVRRVMPGEKGAMLTCSNAAYPPAPLNASYTVLGRVVARLHRI